MSPQRRINVALPEQLYQDLHDLLDWGLRKPLFTTFAEQLIAGVKEHGQSFASEVLSGKVKLR